MSFIASKDEVSPRHIHRDDVARLVWTLFGPSTLCFNPSNMTTSLGNCDAHKNALIEAKGNICITAVPLKIGTEHPVYVQSAHATPYKDTNSAKEDPRTFLNWFSRKFYPNSHSAVGKDPFSEIPDWRRVLFLMDYVTFTHDATVDVCKDRDGSVHVIGHPTKTPHSHY